METKTKIQRCAWVTQFLLDMKGATIEEINTAWLKSPHADNDREKPNRKTWYRCFDSLERVFGILIVGGRKCDKYQWHIDNPEDIGGNNIEQWMLSLMSYRNLIDKCMCIHNRFDLEPYPSENDRLEQVVNAMMQNKKLHITYKRYCCDVPIIHEVDPYYIKNYQSRFYILCNEDGKGYFFCLSFDRIISMETMNETFSMKTNLSAKEFFAPLFGVLMPPKDMKPEKIVVRAYGDQQCYLRDVPLHQSQMEIFHCKDYADFRLFMYPTSDFTGHVLHQEDRMEIISPEWLREDMKRKYKRGLARYMSKPQ